MINQEDIQNNVQEIISDKNLFPDSELFIVLIKVSKDNLIQIFVDGMNGIGIEECAKISKAVEKKMNRETEDFELQVSSPGLDKPFKVIQQYRKHINKEIAVKLKDGHLVNGILLAVGDQEIIVKNKSTGNNKTDESELHINFNQIKETRSIITF